MNGRPACLKTLKKALSLNLSLVEYVRAAHKEILLSAVQLTDPPHYIFVPVAYLAGIQIRKFIPYAVLTCLQDLKVASYKKITHSVTSTCVLILFYYIIQSQLLFFVAGFTTVSKFSHAVYV